MASNNLTQKQYHMQQQQQQHSHQQQPHMMTNSSLSQSFGLSQNEFSQQDILSLRSQNGDIGGGGGMPLPGRGGHSNLLSQDSTYQGDRFSSQAQ